MTEAMEVTTSTPAELLGSGRRHLAVRDYNAAAESLAKACELLAKEHGDTADQCAEAYLWYGKALLGLSREESGVLGDGVPGPGNTDDDDDNEDEEEETEDVESVKENGEVEMIEVESTTKEAGSTTKKAKSTSNEAESTSKEAKSTSKEAKPTSKEAKPTSKEAKSSTKEAESSTKEAESSTKEAESSTKAAESTSKEAKSTSKEAESVRKESESITKEAESSTKEAESTNKEELAGCSVALADDAEPSTTNGEANDESAVNMENEDDVDNLQLAWEMLDLSRSILARRVQGGGEGGEAARAQLAEVHLALGEVALESETYDKAVRDMQSCLDLQKALYQSDDRRIAETHYQIGLANSLASNFEDAITHFKNAANILGTRIKTLESPTAVTDDATVKKYTSNDPFYTVEAEIKELKELLPEIQEKIQDMMDYKAETIKRVRETLCPSNGEGSSTFTNGAGPSTRPSAPAPTAPASDISHLIKRKRKSSDGGAEASPAKRTNT